MQPTIVVNLLTEDCDVYIGRGSKWGNPFVIGFEYRGRTLTRATAISSFREWLEASDEGVTLQADLPELKGKVLGCYCKPQACHGDVLAELANALPV